MGEIVKEEQFNVDRACSELNRNKGKIFFKHELRKFSCGISRLRIKKQILKTEGDNDGELDRKKEIDEKIKSYRMEKIHLLEHQKTFHHHWVLFNQQEREAHPKRRKHGENQYGTPVGPPQNYFQNQSLSCSRKLDFDSCVDESNQT